LEASITTGKYPFLGPETKLTERFLELEELLKESREQRFIGGGIGRA
jgi:hypothetical protein